MVTRILRQPEAPQNDEHLGAVAWQLMGWILIDRARSESSRKRRERANATGGANQTPSGSHAPPTQLFDALSALAELSPRKAEALTLSALCGLSHERIAELLAVSSKTVQRDIEFARAWVASHIQATANTG